MNRATVESMTKEELAAEVKRLRQLLEDSRQPGKRATARDGHAEAVAADTLPALLDASGDSALLMEPDGTVVACNTLLTQRLGCAREELVGVNVFERLEPEAAERRKGFAEQVVRSGKPVRFKDERNGRTWSNSVCPVFSAEGSVSYLAVFARDVTERVEAEEKLRDSEIRFRTMVENLADAVFCHDLDGRFLLVNKIACQLTGYSRDELLGMVVADIDADAVERGDQHRFWLQLNPGEAITMEARHRCKDGSLCPVELRLNRTELDGQPVILGIARDTTDRMKAESALRESEAMYRSVVDSASEGIIVLQDGQRVFYNAMLRDMLGYSDKEFRKLDWITAVHPDDRELVHGRIARRMREEESGLDPVEIRLLKRSGEHLWVRTTSTVVQWDGRPALQAFISDIDERKRAERALRDKHLELEQIFAAMPDGVVYVGTDRRIMKVNPAFSRLHGYTAEEAIGQPTEAFYASKEEHRRQGQVRYNPDARDTQTPYEVAYCRKDGSVFMSETTGTPVRDSDDNVIGYLAVIRDITDKQQAEKALRESEERYRTLVESATFGITLFDTEMRILSANSKMREWYPGIDAQPTRPCYEAWCESPSSGPCPDCPVTLVLADGSPHETVKDCELQGGVRSLRLLAMPLKAEDGSIDAVIYTAEDVTDKLKLEQERAKSQRLESLGVLAGGIAHDFNNILVAILGNISLARMETPPEADIQELLEDAQAASERARDLTQQLLTFSKGGAPMRKSTDIREIIRESAGLCLRGSNVKCEFDFASDLDPVEIDPGQFNQVFNNLIINADQAMPRGGILRLSAANFTVGKADKLPLAPGDYIRVTVVDEGVGIPRGLLGKIFDPFFTTKDRGSGLGLASSFSIAKRHGGHIEVDSEPGAGTTFSVYIPASERAAGGVSASADGTPTGTGRILVVDDERIVRNLAEAILSRLGYEPCSAEDGHRALELFQEARASGRPFDALLIDLTIPGGLGGKEIVTRLLEIDPEVKAVVSSGYSNDPVMADYRKHGFVGRVAKPYHVSELAQALHAVLGSGGERSTTD